MTKSTVMKRTDSGSSYTVGGFALTARLPLELPGTP